MKAKEVAVIIISVVILIGLIVALFVGDATNKTVLTVGNEKFDIKDFENYVKVWNYEDSSSKDDVDTLFRQYQVYKIYSKRANDVGLTLDEGEVPTLESGDDVILLRDYNLTSGDYVKVKSEIALGEKLYASPYEYGKVPEEVDHSYLHYLMENGAIDSEELKTYNFRVVEVLNEVQLEEESGDVSGDVSGDKSGEAPKEDPSVKSKETITKLLAFVKANLSGDVSEEELDAIIDYSGEKVSGDVFTQIASKIPTTRYIQNGAAINMKTNGELDEVSSFYLNTDYSETSTLASWGLVSPELISGIKDYLSNAKEAGFSEPFEIGDGYAFVYVESINDGLNEADELRLNNEAANYYIETTANMTYNKALVNNINLEKLIPKVAQDKAEEASKAQNSGDSNVVSEPVVELGSGEVSELHDDLANAEIVSGD